MPPVLQRAARALARTPGLGDLARALRRFTLRLARPVIIGRYLRRPAPRKLQLGGAGHADWLNTDLEPQRWPSARLDATKPFALPDASFQFVFSEHMIEHLPLDGARSMLHESFRVLAPGGSIRIATPDLARVVRMYETPDTTEHRRYFDRSLSSFRLAKDLPPRVVVINSLFHDHGHQFLFDEPTLFTLLAQAGFTDIRRWTPGESDLPPLRGIELHHHVISIEDNLLETLILQARKP